MSTIKSSAEDLTLNADGSGNDIKFQSNAVEVGELTDGGVLSSTGGSTHADNVKAKFGTGNDLEVYHDGTNSYVHEGGTGDLRLCGDNLGLMNAAHTEFYLYATTDGAVDVKYNNATKLATSALGVTITGGVSLGGTAAANTLDDYEEGTFTPALSGMTTAGNTAYAGQAGFYEKIGRTVHIRGSVEVSSKGTIDGLVLVTGLPFTAATTTQRSCIHLGYADHFSITASESISGTVMSNDTTFLLRVWGDTGGTVNMDDARLSDSSDFYFSGTYYV